MAQLSKEELAGRLSMDYRVASAMTCKAMPRVRAFRSAEGAMAERDAISDEKLGHLATHYRIDYRIKTLSGRGVYTDEVTVIADLVANGNYPYSQPSCWVVSRPLPWSPHFKEGAPICLGEIWAEARGKILLGHLLNHIAKLLNYDEAARGSGYVGWNGEAINYWKTVLKGGPITPGLVYPTPDVRHTHAAESFSFRPRPQKPASAPSAFSGRRVA